MHTANCELGPVVLPGRNGGMSWNGAAAKEQMVQNSALLCCQVGMGACNGMAGERCKTLRVVFRS